MYVLLKVGEMVDLRRSSQKKRSYNISNGAI